MIHATGITKKFGSSAAVDGVSFRVPPGGSLALWGSNGAGKTTLIHCLLGVLRFRGRAALGGIDVRRHGRRARALVGYVPQELAFHDDARVGPSMRFFANLRRAGAPSAAAALADIGLAGHERKRVRDLSGGMKQRLALAIAILADPPIIVLDEPTSNLDAVGRDEVVATLRTLKESGKTLLFASHRPEEVVGLADRVLVMERGRIVREATPSQLWPSGSGARVMRLHLDMASEQAAAAILRGAGHTVHLNGHGLCVAVPENSKAAPICDLARARIEVRDMELLKVGTLPEVTS